MLRWAAILLQEMGRSFKKMSDNGDTKIFIDRSFDNASKIICRFVTPKEKPKNDQPTTSLLRFIRGKLSTKSIDKFLYIVEFIVWSPIMPQYLKIKGIHDS
jgi:hypothetical protein